MSYYYVPDGGATGGERGTFMLWARDTTGRGPPFATFFTGGDGLVCEVFGAVVGGFGAIPGGLGAKLGLP